MHYGGFPVRLVGATVEVKPNLANTDGYFNYIGTHEVGHTLGLGNCLCADGCCSPGLSIMGGHSDFSFNTGGPTSVSYTHLTLPTKRIV